MWGNIAEESCDVCDCSSMIASNAFAMNTLSAGSSGGSASRSAGSSRRAQRRLHIAAAAAPQHQQGAFAQDDDEADKSMADELSFYDMAGPAQRSPRSCTSSPCMDMDMYSPQSSPTSAHALAIGGSSASTGATTIGARRSFLVDYNSLDSGYEATSTSVASAHSFAAAGFKFAEPTGVAPKLSPPKSQLLGAAVSTSSSSSPPQSTSCFRPFNSVSTDSVDSMDDDYMDLLDMETMDDAPLHHHGDAAGAGLPSHFSAIISGAIRTQSPPQTSAGQRAPLRRCLSLIENNTPAPALAPKTPEPLMTIHTPVRAFKRPEAPAFSPTHSKRFKPAGQTPSPMGKENQLLHHNLSAAPSSSSANAGRHLLRKSISMNDANIMSALARSSTEPDLIGDFSKPYALPLMAGRHRDLKSISAATMAGLLRGEYADTVASFRVVDCRYPYEFEGGHIVGAENLYTQEAVLRELVHRPSADGTASVQPDGSVKRNIVVFHCEFSSERGPKLSRFLRNHDRQCNTNVYPALHYPEVYLLHGGYKEFYELSAGEMCAPAAYRPMLDPAYGSAYKHFRAQTKSWSSEAKTAASSSAVSAVPATRLMKSRSRLVL